jgi:hypothetical protein
MTGHLLVMALLLASQSIGPTIGPMPVERLANKAGSR